MTGQYQDLQARIADELARGDLTTQIALAIQGAIRCYERERFVFNEALATWSTAAGKEWYGTADGLPADIVEIDSLRVVVAGRATPLALRSLAWLEQVATAPAATGVLAAYSWYAQQVRLHPVPNAAWPLTLAYVKRLPPLANPTDANAWTDTAEELIRARAKADLAINVIRDPDAQAAQAALAAQGKRFFSAPEEAAYGALRDETTKRLATGRVRASAF